MTMDVMIEHECLVNIAVELLYVVLSVIAPCWLGSIVESFSGRVL